MENVYFCTFADSRMPATLKRIERQAKESGFFKEIYTYDENGLDVGFKEKFKDKLIKGSPGFGYWVWKPHVILETLKKIPENSILLYADAGCHIVKEGAEMFNEYVKRVRQSISGFLTIEQTIGFLEREYTKGDIFDYFDVRNDKSITDSFQRAATTFFLVKNKDNIRFIENWLAVFHENFALVDNSPSTSENLQGFVQNQNDQSFFSILSKFREIELIPCDHIYAKDKKYPIWAMQDKKLKLVYRYSLKRFIKKVLKKFKNIYCAQ